MKVSNLHKVVSTLSVYFKESYSSPIPVDSAFQNLKPFPPSLYLSQNYRNIHAIDGVRRGKQTPARFAQYASARLLHVQNAMRLPPDFAPWSVSWWQSYIFRLICGSHRWSSHDRLCGWLSPRRGLDNVLSGSWSMAWNLATEWLLLRKSGSEKSGAVPQ